MKIIIDNEIIDLSMVWGISKILNDDCIYYFIINFLHDKSLNVKLSFDTLLFNFKELSSVDRFNILSDLENQKNLKFKNFLCDELDKFKKEYDRLIQFWSNCEKINLPNFNFSV